MFAAVQWQPNKVAALDSAAREFRRGFERGQTDTFGLKSGRSAALFLNSRRAVLAISWDGTPHM
jgi:hypothetical protein